MSTPGGGGAAAQSSESRASWFTRNSPAAGLAALITPVVPASAVLHPTWRRHGFRGPLPRDPSSRLRGASLGPQDRGSGPSAGTCPLPQPAPSLPEGLMEQTFLCPGQPLATRSRPPLGRAADGRVADGAGNRRQLSFWSLSFTEEDARAGRPLERQGRAWGSSRPEAAEASGGRDLNGRLCDSENQGGPGAGRG